ncbi:MAG: hypothetical protein V3S36_10515 [Acidiferrobacterales bacterium]
MATESTYEAAFVNGAHAFLPMPPGNIGWVIRNERQAREHAQG